MKLKISLRLMRKYKSGSAARERRRASPSRRRKLPEVSTPIREKKKVGKNGGKYGEYRERGFLTT